MKLPDLFRGRWTVEVAALLFFLALALVFFAPVLFGNATLLPLDNLYRFPPWQSFAASFGVGQPHNALLDDLVLENYPWKKFILDSLKTEESTDVRMATVCSMKQIKDTRAVYPLIALLGDEKLGYLASSVLGQMGEMAVEPLLLVLKDENPAKRAHAATALGDIGLSRVVNPLREMLCDLDPDVRKTAQRAMQKLSGEDGSPSRAAAKQERRPTEIPLK